MKSQRHCFTFKMLVRVQFHLNALPDPSDGLQVGEVLYEYHGQGLPTLVRPAESGRQR